VALRRIALLPAGARLAGLALWQLASGLSNVVLGWPLVAALAHTGGAAALVVVLTWALCESRHTAGALASAHAQPKKGHCGCTAVPKANTARREGVPRS
jgi:cytochrome c oxidase assembly protein subunit 15